MRLRRQTKKRNRALDAVGTYLKFKALPVVAGVGAAGAVAVRKRRQSSAEAA